MFLHCMSGWRSVFCLLDNLVPHDKVAGEDEGDPDDCTREGRRGFRWVCWMHDKVGEK